MDVLPPTGTITSPDNVKISTTVSSGAPVLEG